MQYFDNSANNFLSRGLSFCHLSNFWPWEKQACISTLIEYIIFLAIKTVMALGLWIGKYLYVWQSMMHIVWSQPEKCVLTFVNVHTHAHAKLED